MCFSATASFSASIVIGTIGVATYKKSKDSDLKFLGAIPFFRMGLVAHTYAFFHLSH
jgi:hypothetical protein